jgi:epimerase transport system membrane fusion protein
MSDLERPALPLDWLNSDRRARQLGYLVVAFMFGIGVLWTALAPIESASIAPGVVQVEGKRKSVQHLEGGLISAILVKDGDWVDQGQELILLDSAKDRADRDILQGRIFNIHATLDRLRAERDSSMQLIFSPSLLDTAGSDPRAANAMESERALFKARLEDRLGEESVIQSRISGLRAVLAAKESILNSLTNEIDELSELLEDGYVDKQRMRELERTRAQVIGEVSDLNVSIEEGLLKIAQLKIRFKTEVVDSLVDHLEKAYDLEQQYSAVADRVSRATIRAPVPGFVMDLVPNTIGGVAGAGQVLMEIVPDINNLIISARVSPMDIDRVKVGQTAEIRFGVFKDVYLVTGSLVSLSADRLTDENSDLPYYLARVELDQGDLALLENNALVPGMPAEVLIKTGTRTFLGYIASPLNRMFSRSLTED